MAYCKYASFLKIRAPPLTGFRIAQLAFGAFYFAVPFLTFYEFIKVYFRNMNRIEPERWVTLKYFMRTHFPDGSLKDHPEERFRFIYGVERQVPTLEAALEGTGLVAKSRITIPASEIYGEYDPELVREIPKKGLIKQRLKEGQFYRQMKKGCLVSFKVIEVRPETVLVDFNRPMAGIKVSMELEVMEIKEAKKGEINAAVDAQVKREIGCG